MKGTLDDTGMYGVRLPKISHVSAMNGKVIPTDDTENKDKLSKRDMDTEDQNGLRDTIKSQAKIQDEEWDYKTAPINEVADRIMKFDKIFINSEMRKRAIGARICHCKMGHPSDGVFGHG